MNKGKINYGASLRANLAFTMRPHYGVWRARVLTIRVANAPEIACASINANSQFPVNKIIFTPWLILSVQ